MNGHKLPMIIIYQYLHVHDQHMIDHDCSQMSVKNKKYFYKNICEKNPQILFQLHLWAKVKLKEIVSIISTVPSLIFKYFTILDFIW